MILILTKLIKVMINYQKHEFIIKTLNVEGFGIEEPIIF